MSPAADVLYTAVTFAADDGSERYGYAMVPRETPGVVVHDDWDALGMRASGSHTVSFEDVELPATALRGGFPVGDASAYIQRNVDAGLFHAATSLGVAEGADTYITRKLAERRVRGRRPHADAGGGERRGSCGVSGSSLSRRLADRRPLRGTSVAERFRGRSRPSLR